MAITMKGAGVDVATALALSFPFAVAFQFVITLVYTAMAGVSATATKALDNKQFKKFRLCCNLTVWVFLVLGFVIGFAGAMSAEGLEKVISLIPTWLNTGLSVAGAMLPAIGFAMILNVMAKKELIHLYCLDIVRSHTLSCRSSVLRSLEQQLHFWFISIQEKETNQVQKQKKWRLNLKMASNKLQKKDYTRASLRAYFLQNGMNYSNYQDLDMPILLYPGLRKIYDDDDQLRDALKENVEFFNTNPSMVPFIGNLHLAMLDAVRTPKK